MDESFKLAIKISIIPAIIMTIISLVFIYSKVKESEEYRKKEWSEIKQRASQNNLSQEEILYLVEKRGKF